MPPQQLTAATTGGLAAALLTHIFQPPEVPLPAVTCQDLGIAAATALELHWPSVLLGILLGLALAQLLDLIYLCRQYLSAAVRHRIWAFANALQVKQRLA